jgi:serine/threonine protein kinase
LAKLVAREAVDQFSGYHLLGVLGVGNIGGLYVAEQSGGGGQSKIVALRSFDLGLVNGANVQTAILDSARIATTFDHSNIVAMYELGYSKGQHFVTMEYLPGEDLASILALPGQRFPMPPDVVAAVAQRCADGLHYAHRACEAQGVTLRSVHRDISPSKIFLTYQGAVKLLGLGMALVPGEPKDLPGVSREDFAYTAPEELDGSGSDERSDLFSLGVVLWECLTGRRLFGADTAIKTMDAVRSRYVEPPSVFRAEVPSALDEITLRAVSRDPRRRYQNAQEMSRALQSAIVGQEKRPSSHDIGVWLENLFGKERALLKMQVSQPTASQAALAELKLLGPLAGASSRTSRALDDVESTGPSLLYRPDQLEENEGRGQRPIVRLAPSPLPEPIHSSRVVSVAPVPASRFDPGSSMHGRPILAEEPRRADIGESAAQERPQSQPARRPRTFLAVFGVLAGLAVVAVLVLFLNHEDSDLSNRLPLAGTSVGALQVQSTPPGAQVLVDGDPSGFITPTRIGGLRVGQKMEVRVDKAGYKSAKQTVEIHTGAPGLVSFVLQESVGRVRLEGVPPHAVTFIDDTPIGSKQPLSLLVGPHRLRIEISGRLYASQSINVRPGEQAIRILPSPFGDQ